MEQVNSEPYELASQADLAREDGVRRGPYRVAAEQTAALRSAQLSATR